MYKRIFISCLFIFSLCQCQKKYQDENEITDERVGNIIIGASKSDVLSKLEMYKLENLGGSVQTYYKVFNANNELLLSLEFLENKLWAIQVHHKKYYTNNEISVGDIAFDIKLKGYANMILASKNYLYSQKGNIFLFFEKKITKSGEIDEEAKLTSITVGNIFNINNI